MSNQEKFRFSLLPLSLAISLAVSGQAAIAQEYTDEELDLILEEVTVTGSRIKRKDTVSPSPLVTTDVGEISQSGKATIDDYLKEMPQFAPGSGDFSNDSNGGTAGRATLNLRNLGAKRNLVIMDGRRLMSSGTDGAIDINTIPSLAIGSIEVITGGASATYGSDALSGVVNFKTRTDLDGLEVDAQYSSLDRDGESSYRIGAAFGTEYGDGKGNLLLSAEYRDRGGVRLREREFFMVNPQASSFIGYGMTRSGPSTWSVDSSGSVFDSSDVDDANTGLFTESVEEPLIVRGDDLRTLGAYNNYIQVPLEQTTLFAKTDYELDNGVTAYGHALFASSTAFNEGAAPISAGIWGLSNIPLDNYYLQQNPDFIAAARVGAGGINNYQIRVTQAGGRVYNTENDVYQFLGGLSGSFSDRDLNWDVHFSYGETETTDKTTSGSINFVALQNIVDTTDPTTGESSVCSGGFNPWGGLNPLSADCLDYISRTPSNVTTLEQTVLEGLLEGKLFDMPGGEARFALSANYRENTYDYDADSDIELGQLSNLSSSADTTGDIEVAEIAGEVLLPLTDIVNLTLGARLSEYEPAGTTETYKVELDARVIDSLLLRGGFQHAVRAPNVEEFFRASLLRVQPFLDVCSSRFRGHVNEVEETALCDAQGNAPSYTQGGSSAPTVTNGNPDLVPEEADTFTLGAVYEFTIGEDISAQLTFDYYNIEVDKAIETLTAQQIMTKCFNLDGASNPTYDNNYFPCQQITRIAGGTDLAPVNQPVLNLGGIETAGFDIAANFDIPVDALAWGDGDGGIRIKSLVNILEKHEIQAFEDEEFVDFAGVASTALAYPELKVHNAVAVDTGPLTVSLVWRHISGMDDLSAAGGVETDIEGTDSYDYFDLTARMSFGEQFEVYAGINNLEDKDPPQIGGSAILGEADSGTNQGVYDAIGRSMYLGIKASF